MFKTIKAIGVARGRWQSYAFHKWCGNPKHVGLKLMHSRFLS